MTLRIYRQTGPGTYEAISTDGSFTNPITTVHHGRNGDVFEEEFYVGRVSGSSSSYSNIQVLPKCSGAWVDWTVKVMVDPGHDPTETEWAAIVAGDPADIADLSSDAKLPFWYRIESPRGIRIGNRRDISLYLLFTETPGV